MISRCSSSSNGGGSQGIIFFSSNETQANENTKQKNILCSSSIGCKANIHDDDGENASSSSSSSSAGDLIFKACTTTTATIVPSLCSGTLCLFVCVCLFVHWNRVWKRWQEKRENLHASKSLPFFPFLLFSCSPPFARLHLAPPPPQTKAVIFLPFFWNCCCCCCNRNHRNAAAVQCSTHSQNRLE